jgi:hypothetical protein
MSEGPPLRRRQRVLAGVAELGASVQAAIPGLYAWAVTVAPAAWSRGAPLVAKVAAAVGVLALVTAPLIEHANPRSGRLGGPLASWSGPERARIWSVWGLVLSSSVVWALAPSALSSARFDGVRGALGMVGWALFAFASAGPALRSDPDAEGRIIAGTPLKPRSELPRGDGVYVALGVASALALQSFGWAVASPERAVLVRLVTIVCGIAVLGGATSIALGRHGRRIPAAPRRRLARAMPWVVVLLLCGLVGLLLAQGR